MTLAPEIRTRVDVSARMQDGRKTYGVGGAEVRALDGVDIEFERGSFSAIMGPSGSGKSTLLHIMGLLDEPSSGTHTFLAVAVPLFLTV